MNKLWRQMTESRRGETYNPLIYPFLISTLAYGIGFLFFAGTADVGKSSLFVAMSSVLPGAPQIWGAVAIATIIMGVYFLFFDRPTWGRVSGLFGFMVWVFACCTWILTGAFLVFVAVGVPNLIFWFWQYLSLSRFHREEVEDALDA